jgi:hypothetical protein
MATTLERNDELNVIASPNPYTGTVYFRFTSPVSGKATLEAYDLVGKKLATIYEGNVDAGVERVIKYNVSAGNRVTMVYKLTVGDKTSHGMLVPQK